MKTILPVWLLWIVSTTATSLRKLAAENAAGVLNVHVVPHTHDDGTTVATIQLILT